MKFLALLLLVGVCTAQQKKYSSAPAAGSETVVIRSEHDNSADGTFRWVSELSDGNRHEQSGYIKAGPDPDHPIQVIQGSFSYITPEGETIELQYIADENGFQPIGAHVPRLPAPVTQSQQQPQQQRPQQPQQRQQSRPQQPQQRQQPRPQQPQQRQPQQQQRPRPRQY